MRRRSELQRIISEHNIVQSVGVHDIIPIEFLRFRIESGQDEELASLVESIRKHGVLEPALVRRSRINDEVGGDAKHFELISGSRRYAACMRLGLKTIPCLLVDADDQTAFEISLVENLQRMNLNPIEEAEAFKLYVTNFGRGSVTRLAHRIGKSEEYVSHRLLLLGLPKTITDRISRRLLGSSHVTELIWLKAEEKQIQLADLIQKHHLSFREVRNVVHTVNGEGIAVDIAVERTLKIRGEVSKKHDAAASDSSVSVDSWPAWEWMSDESESDDSLKVFEHAALVIRTALAGLDFLVQKAGDEAALRTVLMRERLAVHGVLDDLIRAKIGFKKNSAESKRELHS